MSKSVKLRRGTLLDHSQFAGAEGEITIDTDLDTIRVHDGSTLGGWPLLNTAKNAEITASELIANKILYKNSWAGSPTVNPFPLATAYPGMLAYSQTDSKAYISNGTTWVSFTQPNDLTNFVVNSANTTGTGNSIIAPKSGTNLVFKTLTAGNNISINADTNSLQIASASYTASNVYDNVVGSYGLFNQLDGLNFEFRSIRPGSGLTMSQSVSSDEINIDTLLKQAYNNINVDTVDIGTNEVNSTLNFTSGNGILLTPNATTRTIDVAVDLNVTSDDQQTGQSVIKSYANGEFVFNKIKAGVGVSVQQDVNGEILINAPEVGTVTGGQNLGLAPGELTGGVAIFESTLSSASTLQFRRLRVGSGLVVQMSPDQQYVDLALSSETPGGAGQGVVDVGPVYRLAYYPLAEASSRVGPTSSSIYVNTTGDKLVADIVGTVSSISNHTTSNLTEGTNLYYTQGRFDTAFAATSTDALTEGANNLYFTTERAQDSVKLMMEAGNPVPSSATATTTAARTSIATLYVTSTTGILAGMTVTGAGFGNGVTVQAVPSSTSFTVSPAVFAPTGTTVTLIGASTIILNTSQNSISTALLTLDSTVGISTGWYVNGTGIQGAVTVQSILNDTSVSVSPGYNVSTGVGVPLTFSPMSPTGITGIYSDITNTFTYRLDPTYLSQQIRNSVGAVAGAGLSYDSVSGRFNLSGAVTSVNGYSGAVTLTVGDISGAAPITNPTFLASGSSVPRTPDILAGATGLQIANKNYVDAAKLSITGSPLAGLSTLQQIGNALNGDSLFYQTTASQIAAKLSSSGGVMSGNLNLNYLIDFSTSSELIATNKRYVDQRATVQTVNTKSGNIVLTTDDISERLSPSPVNLWYTTARARGAISLTTSDTNTLRYDIATGVFTFVKPNTDGIAEAVGATNKYFTSTRARQSFGLTLTSSGAPTIGGAALPLAAYDETTGVFTFNANIDNLSDGLNNKFYTDQSVWSALELFVPAIGTSAYNTQNQILTYNDTNGQFTLVAHTGNIPEKSGGPYYFTPQRVADSVSVTVTQLASVLPSNILTAAYDTNTSKLKFTFNANSSSIAEGDKLFFTEARARSSISLSSNDTTVLTYDSATGVLTFVKPTTDKISEGLTNLYFTQPRARTSVSVANTNNVATPLTYDNSTGVFTFNASIDNFADGSTNKFASVSRVAGIISLNTTTTDGGTAPTTLLTYVTSTGAFTYNNSTDSLREGTINKWASDATVRGKLSTNSQTTLTYSSSTGVFTYIPTVSPSLTYTASPGLGAYHFDTIQDITTTGKPKFSYVTRGINPTTAYLNTAANRLAVDTGQVTFNCSVGSYHEVNRDRQITALAFNSVPAAGQYFEVTITFVNNVGTAGFSNSGASILWANSTIPTLSTTSGKRDIIKIYTIDGGANWYELSRSLNVG